LPPRDEFKEVEQDMDESEEFKDGLLASVAGNLESFNTPGLVGRDLHSSCGHGATESLTELLVAFLVDFPDFDRGGGADGGGQKLSSSSIKDGCRHDEEAEEYADDEEEQDDRDEADMESLDEHLVDFFNPLLANWSTTGGRSGGEILPDRFTSSSSLNLTVSHRQCLAAIPRVAPPSLGTEAHP